MTVTFEIPEDIQADVSGIPDIGVRLALFLRHEAQLETVRRARLSAEARDIAGRAMLGAQRDQKEGFDWNASFELIVEELKTLPALKQQEAATIVHHLKEDVRDQRRSALQRSASFLTEDDSAELEQIIDSNFNR